MANPYTFDPAPDSTHNMVIGLVPRGARVLEFGCATGYLSAELARRLDCTVTGIELSDEAADEARGRCARVIVADAERIDLEETFGDERFDAILFADVLEHLREPGTLLGRVRPFLAEGGTIVASIPNIAHGSARVRLLQGEWRYRPLGLLDETHLRFFTRDGVRDLFEAAGYVVTHWHRKRQEIEDTELGVQVPDALRPFLHDTEVTTYQFIVRAITTEPAEVVRQLRRDLAAASERVAFLEVETKKATDRLGMVSDDLANHRIAHQEQQAHLDALTAQIAALTDRESERRKLLQDAHAQLLERDRLLIDGHARREALRSEIAHMKSTKLWSLGSRYWHVLDRVNRLRGRKAS